MSQDDTKNITSPIVNSPVKPTTNNKKSNKVPFIGAISDIIDIARFFFFSQGKSDNSEVMISKEVSEFSDGIVTVRDILAPSSIEVDFDYIKINQKYYRTYFAALFPRFVNANWLAPLINFERTIDISMYYFTVDSREVMLKLRRKIAEMEATLNTLNEQGKVLDPNVKVALEDANLLQEQLAKGEEKFFHFSVYITIQTDTEDELNKFGKELETVLSASGLIIKSAYLQQEFAFQSVIPTNNDKLMVVRNMDTTSIATTFPFISSDLSSDSGILYGINKYNKGLVIYDRFSNENYNTVIFARSGAGKSYLAKLEALRSLMLGVEVIIIDPEREYEKLCTVVGGSYLSFSQDGASKINPFDLSGIYDTDEDELRFKILSLHGLFRIILGNGNNEQLTAIESAVLDKAIINTYREKGITTDPLTQKKEPPVLQDLYKVLLSMEENESQSLAKRLEKFITGSASGIFDKKTNIEINNEFTVFSIRDLSEELRPAAMYLMLDYIWTKVKKKKKKRILMIDEAWILMKYPDSAQFINGLAKRARKYYLGVTTITQDVEDFFATDYGKAVVNNAAMQILLKQSPSAINNIQKVFFLSDGEKDLLLNSAPGEGLFFAGANHVAITIKASEYEHNLITSNPQDIINQEKEALKNEYKNSQQLNNGTISRRAN